ncbi:COG3014 family protein [Elusimicrobiota bacterium]
MAVVKQQIIKSDFNNAINEFEKTGLDKQERNSLLYHLEAGLLYHLAGLYKESNSFLENAEWISDELYTRSLSKEAATLITSDNILPYRGEYYEYLFSNYYKLLNYLYMNNLEDALVEVRRINHKLSLFKQDDAFLHYLTAILYQFNMQDADAFIEYRKAYKAYSQDYESDHGIQMPLQLKKDIAVFCRESSFSRCREFPKSILDINQLPKDYGSVVIILETGFIPDKKEERIEAAIPQDYRKKHPDKLKEVYYLTVAIPAYSPESDFPQEAVIELDGKEYQMDLVEDLSSIARKRLNEKKTGIIAKATARAVTKYVAYKAVRGNSGEQDDGNQESKNSTLKRLLGTAVNIAGAATEQADTRSWLTLPNRIFLTRYYLGSGSHKFKINIRSSEGNLTTSEVYSFALKKGELKFIILRL